MVRSRTANERPLPLTHDHRGSTFEPSYEGFKEDGLPSQDGPSARAVSACPPGAVS
jgi:hypothetical protein